MKTMKLGEFIVLCLADRKADGSKEAKAHALQRAKYAELTNAEATTKLEIFEAMAMLDFLVCALRAITQGALREAHIHLYWADMALCLPRRVPVWKRRR